MKRKPKTYKRFKKLHKWFGIILALFIIGFAVSGVILNHREVVSGIDVPREYLPKDYQYNNWNLAAIRGNVYLGKDSMLVYGNIGTWITNDDFSTWRDFNTGFPQGIDNRKISKVIRTEDGSLFAGTLFGLYQYQSGAWLKSTLPVDEARITDLFLAADTLYVLTRSHLLKGQFAHSLFFTTEIPLPEPSNYDNKVSLFRTLWVIHSGEILGMAGKLFSDLMALALIFLTVTGIMLWLFPGIIKTRKKKNKAAKGHIRSFKWSLKWHNKLGYILFIFLLISSVTGIFLRPPLLIPIAGKRIAKIPHTMLADQNVWHDKLRAGIYDAATDRIILSTADGFYYSDDNFQSKLKSFTAQPPVSVMGINVFEYIDGGGFLIGSFSGLFTWFPEKGYIANAITGNKHISKSQSGNPIGEDVIAGLVWTSDGFPFYFDYGKGCQPWRHEMGFPKMPEHVRNATPLSLWNVALEVHTARIYGALIGDFYILIVPLAGLSLILILITGLWMYLKKFSKKRPPQKQQARH